MPRPPRNLSAGIYHLAAHGSDTRDLFLDRRDREDFLARLASVCERFELGLISYILLDNHYHALIRTPDARLSRALQHLHTEYSRTRNRRHGRSAHLFRAHPLLRQIVSEAQLLASCRYLARNPVEAGLVAHPLDWEWSSARAHAGLERPRIPLSEHDLQDAFGADARWRDRYRSFVENDEGPRERAFQVAGAGFEPATSGL